MADAETHSVAQSLAEWDLSLDPSITYELDKVFPKTEGWGAKGEVKRKVKLIQNVEPVLRRILLDGEQVLYVAKGVQYNFSEQYFMGIWANLINQTVFVLTNARLLMIRTDSKGRPKETFWMVAYSQIDKFKGSWTGTVEVKLRDGLKLKFTGFPKTDRKSMPTLFEEVLETYRKAGVDPQVTQSRENLCTYCFDCVPKNEYTCGQCKAEFWRPGEVAMRSLVFPSWGDFVMKHTSLAIIELLGYAVMWLIIISLWVSAISGADGMGLAGAAILSLIMLAFSHVPDAALTYYVAKKGLHPKAPPPQAAP